MISFKRDPVTDMRIVQEEKLKAMTAELQNLKDVQIPMQRVEEAEEQVFSLFPSLPRARALSLSPSLPRAPCLSPPLSHAPRSRGSFSTRKCVCCCCARALSRPPLLLQPPRPRRPNPPLSSQTHAGEQVLMLKEEIRLLEEAHQHERESERETHTKQLAGLTRKEQDWLPKIQVSICPGNLKLQPSSLYPTP